MHPASEELIAFFDARRRALLDVVARVPSVRLGERPQPDRWSIAEIVAHVGLVERRVIGALSKRFEAARAAGLRAVTMPGSVIDPADAARAADRGRRLTAPDAVQPGAAVTFEEALAALDRTKASLRDLVERADGFAVDEIALPHPYFGDLTLYRWVVVLAGHETRPAAQIEEMLADG